MTDSPGSDRAKAGCRPAGDAVAGATEMESRVVKALRVFDATISDEMLLLAARDAIRATLNSAEEAARGLCREDGQRRMNENGPQYVPCLEYRTWQAYEDANWRRFLNFPSPPLSTPAQDDTGR